MPVSLIGPRSRYNVVTNSPTWVYHKMADGQSLDGTAPRTATSDEAATDPVVTAGKAVFSELTKGGLFTLLAHAKKALVVDEIVAVGAPTITLEDVDGLSSRPAPAVPFRVSPSEVLKASGGSLVGFLVRIDGEKQL